jgi:hypothetical protein
MLFNSLNTYAQIRNFYGRIIDKDSKKGIPQAIIEEKNGFEGIYCDENGNFAFEGNIDSVKEFIFYCQGYEKKEISVCNLPKDSIIIELDKEYINIDNVTITGEKKKLGKEFLEKKI